MGNNDKKMNLEYFAAQNSYYGFINHFTSVFNSEKYQKIFVLKGGPGTGKSSLMKKLASKFEGYADVTKIFCSSDINSLDGVIICKNERCIAILDGTAPHERDAVIPGAVDELINLGEFWDSSKLELKKEKIISLNKEKKHHYKSAYDFLSTAGIYSKKIKSAMSGLFDKEKLKKRIEAICENSERGESYKSDLLHSAFGKGGYQTLQAAFSDVDESVHIAGDRFIAQTFMNLLCDELNKRSIKHSVFSSPLDPDDCETVVISNLKEKIAYTTRQTEKELLVDGLLTKNPSDIPEINIYLTDYEKYEELAKNSFLRASKTHFLLEDIYTPLMDFSMLDKTLLHLEKKIAQVIE